MRAAPLWVGVPNAPAIPHNSPRCRLVRKAPKAAPEVSKDAEARANTKHLILAPREPSLRNRRCRSV
jgi:hypothetical protein